MNDRLTKEYEILTGVVEDVVYYNNENGYAVCYISAENDFLTVVGCMPFVNEGEEITVKGFWTYHSEYGKQFKVEEYEKHLPRTTDEIYKFLSSGIIFGIREATAKKIVDMFGEEALDVISMNPERLSDVSGISKKRALEIGASYAENLGVRDVVIYFQKFGLSASAAMKVYKRYGAASIDAVKENPYILSTEVYGIGFKTADQIAMKMGTAHNSTNRIEAGINYILWNASYSGHVFLPENILVKEVSSLLGVSEEEAQVSLTDMVFKGEIIKEVNQTYDAIYQPALYNAEVYTASKLKRISEVAFVQKDMDIEAVIEEFEREIGITLAESQKKAVRTAIKSGAVVITGGPGTGKTTIIKAIIKIMEKLGKTVVLAAPTGRAAKRMSELCDMEAKTIHRLLEASFSEDKEKMSFSKNENSPLECEVLIVDEMSMVDITLASSLFKAIRTGTRVIMVGDADQLPSVGAGNVLRDIISSSVVDTVYLSEIFRQASESMIVVNAHKINTGEFPVMNGRDSDFFMIYKDDADSITDTIVELCASRLPAKYGYNPVEDIQVLTPTRKGYTGVNVLNGKLQEKLNPADSIKRERKVRDIILREGDKVMQTKNNYQIEWTTSDGFEGTGVFNGDYGTITDINHAQETVTVMFDEKEVVYDFSQLDEIELAYAVTVHKSQGSEFDAVVIPIYPTAPILRNRNILYTAVTRAKKLVVLVGRRDALSAMVENVNENKRYSGLTEKLES